KSMERAQELNVEKMKKQPPPSKSAVPWKFRTMNNTMGIRTHRDGTNTPVQFYNKAFGQFLKDFHNDDLPTTPAHHEWTEKFISDMSGIYQYEDQRQHLFRQSMESLLKKHVETITLSDRSKNDGMVRCPVGELLAATVIFELKNEISSGNSDPTLQGAL